MIISDLPKKIAIFPLSNAIFFPKTILPLNIFEDRYLQLVDDCMKTERLFGMIQPRDKSIAKPNLYSVGCLGKIVNFNETNDKRFIISLSGVIRFRLKEELNTKKLYREFLVDYAAFTNDLTEKKIKEDKYRKSNLFSKIKLFLEKKNYLIEFNELDKLNFDQLISTICMISPFSVEEKQKLVEAIQIDEKLNVLDEIINFNLLDNSENLTIQ